VVRKLRASIAHFAIRLESKNHLTGGAARQGGHVADGAAVVQRLRTADFMDQHAAMWWVGDEEHHRLIADLLQALHDRLADLDQVERLLPGARHLEHLAPQSISPRLSKPAHEPLLLQRTEHAIQ